MGLAVNDERLTLRVGTGVLLLIGAATAFVLLFDGCSLRSKVDVEVYFGHMGSLEEGADVQVAGRVIGRITAVRLIPERLAADPSHPLHPTGGVVCDVAIERRYLDMTMKNGEAFVSSKGMLGQGFLELGPPPGGAAPGEPLEDGDALRGVDPPQVDRVMMRSYQNLLASKLFLAAVAPEGKRLMAEIDALGENLRAIGAATGPEPGAIAALGDSIARLTDRVDIVRDKWEQTGVELADVRALADQARQTLDLTDAAVTELRARADALQADLDRVRAAVPPGLQQRFEQAVTKTRTSLAKLEKIQHTLRDMQAMMERGEGNIGGLTRDPEFSDFAKQIGKALKRTPWKIFGTERE
ncbi:MAG TPA: MlaD family protein [Kofleriaceae bacterium]|nr:MlaD family protein [Kofleriaceae bacterium]